MLALNSCGVKSWAAVQLLSPHLPYVEELYLAGNTLPDLPRLRAEQEYRDATGAEETALVEGKLILSNFVLNCLMNALDSHMKCIQ